MPSKSSSRPLIGLIVCLCAVVIVLVAVVAYLATRETGPAPPPGSGVTVTKARYGVTSEGTEIYRYTFKNENNIEVSIINYGGIITNVLVPDKSGTIKDVTLGYDDIAGYEANPPYFGPIVGRYANRIAKGRFSIDGVEYTLAINNGPNFLHGGIKGFHKRIWEPALEETRLVLKYVSRDGEEGFPGELTTFVTYELTADNELRITYNATTTKPTVINLTNHAYFNLAGQGTGNISDHKAMITAKQYLPVDNTSIPLGVIADVTGTLMDLTTPVRLGDRLNLIPGDVGYDHNYCLGKTGWKKYAARVHHESSGRFLEVYTTEPGVQFYTGYFLDAVSGKDGVSYDPFDGFCLETQHYPDSPNQENFPTTVLRPGETYLQETIYKFGVA